MGTAPKKKRAMRSRRSGVKKLTLVKKNSEILKLRSISLNMTQIKFQREIGRMEVLGELLIRDKK